jgi:RecB family exonuclease
VPAVSALSYSSVRAYLECPLRWKFLYIDRLPEAPRGYFSFGRSVHSALEELLRPLVVPPARITDRGETQRTLDEWRPTPALPEVGRLMAKEDLLRIYGDAWVSEGYSSPEEEARYRRLGEDLLLAYYNELEHEPPTPVAVEQHLEARWQGIPVHGYIDRIDRTPLGGFEIVDYKTSRELSTDDAESSDQLSLYQVLVEENYPGRVEHLTLYHLRSLTPIRTAPRPKHRLEELHDRVGKVSDGIRSEIFEPSPGPQCSRCEFRSRCPEFRDVPAPDRARLEALVDQFSELRSREAALGQELERTAVELHREAERLGVHRLPGSKDVAIRRTEEEWRFPPEAVGPLLDRYGLADRWSPRDTATIQRLIRDSTVDPEVRRKLAEAGRRNIRWYWELEPLNGN